jgi:hypothetical protein
MIGFLKCQQQIQFLEFGIVGINGRHSYAEMRKTGTHFTTTG